MSIDSLFVSLNRCDCSPRISVARFLNCWRKRSSSCSRSAFLGVLLFQAGDFRLGRGAQGGQFGFGAQPVFDLHADVRFGLQADLLGGGLFGTQVAGFAAGGGEHGPERRREGAEHDDCKNECGIHDDKGRIFRGIFRIFDRQTL